MLLEETDNNTRMWRGAQCFTCCALVVAFLSIKANTFLKPYSEHSPSASGQLIFEMYFKPAQFQRRQKEEVPRVSRRIRNKNRYEKKTPVLLPLLTFTGSHFSKQVYFSHLGSEFRGYQLSSKSYSMILFVLSENLDKLTLWNYF